MYQNVQQQRKARKKLLALSISFLMWVVCCALPVAQLQNPHEALARESTLSLKIGKESGGGNEVDKEMGREGEVEKEHEGRREDRQ